MKKSGFWTFAFSFIPGCGLMYLGYLKKGLQYMLMFSASVWMTFLTNDIFMGRGTWIMMLFALTMPVIWLFQFFDAMHTRARMKRLEIETPADDGFFYPQNLFTGIPVKRVSAAKSFAIALIVVGGAMLLSLIMDMSNRYLIDEIRGYVQRVNQYLFPVLISLALMIAGARLLRGSRKKAGAENNETEG